MHLLLDIELPLVVRFGKTKMLLGELMSLKPGSVIDLECALANVVELLVNGKIVARGAAVTVEGRYGVRILEIAGADEQVGPGRNSSNGKEC